MIAKLASIEFIIFRWVLLGVIVFFGFTWWQDAHSKYETVAVSGGKPVLVNQAPNTMLGDAVAQALILKQIQFDQAAFLHALFNAPTRTAVGATTIVIPPAAVPKPTAPPGTTPEQNQYNFDVAYAADVKALNDTKIQTTVSITQQAVAPSRFMAGTIIGGGVGLGYAPLRIGRGDLDVLALFQAGRVRPGVGVGYRINGATIGVGVTVNGANRTITSLMLGYAL